MSKKIVFPCLLLLLYASLSSSYSPYSNPHMQNGRQVIVQLFEWRFDDVAQECERFLGPFGFGGVQLSPISENVIIQNPPRPWWERYQPVSYKIVSRSGNESEFASMVARCNKAGVRIYVDVILNHMTGDVGKGYGIGGSYYDAGTLDFKGVPYTAGNFHSKQVCGTPSGNIENYNNETQARVCRLVGLNDLDQRQDYVQNKMAEFLNKLISYGVAGFRLDASKHMLPADLKSIAAKLINLNTTYFPPNLRPFQYHEVVYYSGQGATPDEYKEVGRVCEFRYPKFLTSVIRKENQLLRYLRNFGEGWGMIKSEDAQIFVENHDTQRHVGDEISYRTPRELKMATAFMLSWPYGVPRILSGYNWPQNIKDGKDLNDWIGPPHEDNFEIKHVIINKDITCGNGWTCEHRWRQIYNMVRFRNVAGNESVGKWWDNGFQQIAFSRGDKAFIAINNENFSLDKTLSTGLPGGVYCDVISGLVNSNACTGRTITVNNDGTAHIVVDNRWDDPMIAIHVGAKIR